MERLAYVLHSHFIRNIEEPVKFTAFDARMWWYQAKSRRVVFHRGSDRIKPAIITLRSLELALSRVPSLSLLRPRLSQLTNNSGLPVRSGYLEDSMTTGLTFHFQSRSV